MSKITVIVDTREQRPLLFPDTIMWYNSRTDKGKLYTVDVKKKAMKTGDYTLEGFESAVLIERKGSPQELYNNLFTDDHQRSIKSFERLAIATLHPYLLLDMSPAMLWKPSKYTCEPARIFDALLSMTVRLGIQVWFAGNCKVHKTRRLLGEQMLRLMMAHVMLPYMDDMDVNEILERFPL